MICNLVLDGMHNIGIKNEQFMLKEDKVKTKDVAFIRYRFKEYGEKQIEYIEAMMGKFKNSTHLAEVELYPGFCEDINKVAERFENLAVFLYIPITDENVEENDIPDFYKSLLEEAIENDVMFERIMIRDKSNTLFTVSANKMKNSIRQITNVREDEIGICQSPLSRYDGNACLTALRAREISAKYNDSEETPVPSANHECKNANACSCIKYVVIDRDVQAPADSHKKGGKKKEKPDTNSLDEINTDEKKKKHVKKLPGKIVKNVVNW